MNEALALQMTVPNMSDTATKPSVTIKKYANRRLYNTATSSYVTLEALSQMVREGIEFNVYDAKTSEDITRSVLTQIIVEEEGKSGQQNLLPISFLRQLIGFYGDNMQWLVPKYLEHSMQLLANNQEQLSSYFQTTFGNMFPFGTTFEEMGKQNLAMFERAMRLFSPFASGTSGDMKVSTPTASGASAKAAPAPVPAETPSAAAPVAPKVEPKPEPPLATVTSIVRAPEPPAPPPAPAVEAEDSLPTPAAPVTTPMPNVQNATTKLSPSADDMQQKISNLQRQLADLAKNRG